MASSLSSYLPPSDGFLPKWLLFIAVVSIGNSVQCYISTAGSREVYAGKSPLKAMKESSKGTDLSPVNELSARTFGTWTALSSIIRLYAAYNIHDPLIYQLALWSYVVAFAHFFSEWLVFGSARWNRGFASPVFVSTFTISWMLSQWSYYVGS
ncbi:Ergosterol biosynthetic protein 28 [Pseudocercospora fuligena]|uniref:Ergosterol biosynthetic protein 28 n=1 Tax=Pseudocercospora fuligena TaxID=685502 RepID=A0A8H6VFB9_9PEZI|nr:Ergosterol biosynthetic protein 28 [Pseudocercospora fuligena]